MFEACLNYRTQRVEAAGSIYSVPQDKVLGPIPFTMCINDVYKIEVNRNIVSNARNWVMIYEGENWIELWNAIKEDLNNIETYSDHKLLAIN